jgi:orotate phosphoribosyltransferase
MEEKQIKELFDSTGARLSGHFLLTSGRHSGEYMQCAKLFVHPEVSEKLCAALAAKIGDIKAESVISPALGGMLMGYELARQLKCKNYFAERTAEGVFALRRGFSLQKGERVIVAEDVVTTGGSVKEVIALAKELGAEVEGVAAIVDRSGGSVDFGIPFYSLWQTNIASYDKEECPICKAGGPPPIKPGSRK